MEHGIKSLIDFQSNLPEMLAVDLEQSSDIFQSRQLTAGAPAPGLAADGTRRRDSLPHGTGHLVPVLPTEPDVNISNTKSSETIHHKYSDIFSPLDYNPPARGSVSSSDDSADLEPPSISTREESVLTVDTWLESEKQPSPPYLHISPSDYTAKMSWIDLDGDDVSPITQRRRSSMTDFPIQLQQLQGSMETGVRTLSLRSPVKDGTQAPTTPVLPRSPGCPIEIPKRRSSLGHRGARPVGQQFTWNLDLGQGDIHGGAPPHVASSRPAYEESSSTYEYDTSTSFLDEADFNFRDDTDGPDTSGDDRGVAIASDQVGVDEWLESDMAHLARGEQSLPRPLLPAVQERVGFYVANFPEPLLLCGNLLVEDIRNLSQGVRYNTEGGHPRTTPDHNHHHHYHQAATAGNQPLSHTKPPKWKWLYPSTTTTTSTAEHEHLDPSYASLLAGSRQQPWVVMRKVFPRGSDGLCEALYAYLLVYNYVTALCLRSVSVACADHHHHHHHHHHPSRPNTPRTGKRPGTGASSSIMTADLDLDDDDDDDTYAAALSQPALPKRDKPKWPELLGLAGQDAPPVLSSPPAARPASRDSGGRTSTFTSLRSIPSFLFNGGQQQQQQRQSESRGGATMTPTGAQIQMGMGGFGPSSRPATPSTGRACLGPRGPDQGKQLAALRRGLAVCCARLAITLQRSIDPNGKGHGHGRGRGRDDGGPEAAGRVNPSFMRSLCENVRGTEEAMGRC
ncbi:hypothetical protein F5Y14DRAFT_441060 [Nemania sp. NC0429]|nr:hypothetical protein F5Y14DRAFT_441060 [Nemania sp. NC0429]